MGIEKKLRILITNDDGIMSHGLTIAQQIAQTITDDVWIVAPHDQQSGKSHSITWGMPIRMRELEHKKFAVKGTPTDCIILALSQLMKDHPPDFIFSGVNYGENLAESITVSGTVGAAMQGTIQGIKSIALSQASQGFYPADWSVAKAYGEKAIQQLLHISWPNNTMMNVNFPHSKPDLVKGIRITNQGRRSLVGDMIEAQDPHGHPCYWIGVLHKEKDPAENSDLWGNQNGFITITPITLDLTNHAAIPKISDNLTIDFH
ncbi:MAG: 5'/3'-nucleotidase SurE [Alphaproteobacteria bacterium]|nr:5'/3'-nucleotidase SurE [Alphaproteobacteria bacterium]